MLLGDYLLAISAQYLGICLRYQSMPNWEMLNQGGIRSLIFATVVVLAGYLSELYRGDLTFNNKEIFLRACSANFLAFLGLSVFYYLFPNLMLGRSVLVMALVIFCLLQFLWHCHFPGLLRIPWVMQKVLILGVGPTALQISNLLDKTRHNYELVGFIQPAGEMASINLSSVLGSIESLARTATREKVHKIVISLSERRGVLPVRDILGCKFKGIDIVDEISFYEQITGKLMIERINPSWFIFSNGSRLTPFMFFYKRGFDLLFAAVGLVLFLPLMPLIALAIRVDSKGPVFFRQVRVGKGERPFVLYKFRTMGEDAEKKTGAVWAQEDDPRITRVGRFLRTSRMDEMPQIFNVIRGDMSFIGPRPERPEFVETLNERVPYYSNRHSVKPGVTGWAQVKYEYGASMEDALEKLRYDLYYIKNFSIFLDFLIIMETLKVVIFGRGAR